MNWTEKKSFGDMIVSLTVQGSRIKPICELGGELLAYRKGTLGILDNGGKWTPCVKCISGLKALLGSFRPFERILRLSPRCGERLSDTSAIVSHSGRVLYVDLKNNTVITEHSYCEGMSNPLSFARVTGIEGFADGFYYGEYTGNPEEKEVAVYYRPFDDKPCAWEKVYEFPAGGITHIHAIVPDKYRKGIIVMTGDSDKGSGIYLFFDNFTRRQTVISGSQQSRSCVAFAGSEGIYFATDTPFQQNYIYFASIDDKGKWSTEAVSKIDGSCIYAGQTEDYMLFNTVVETDSEKKDLRLLFTYKRGPGIADWYTKVYLVDRARNVTPVLKYKKDALPMGLCQFGSVSFYSSSEKNTIWLSPTAVNKFDGKLLKLKIEPVTEKNHD